MPVQQWIWTKLRRFMPLLLAFGLMISGTATASIVVSAPALAGTDTYPSEWSSIPMDSVFDDWGEYNRECTSYVAWMLHSVNGFEMPFHGNASVWKAEAQSHGYTVDTTPAVGAVGWKMTSATVGHVAWVESVNNGTVTVEDYNSDYTGHYGEHTVAASTYQYIHFKDLAGGGSGGSGSDVQMILNGNGTVFAKNSIGVGGWNVETGSATATKIAVGGTTQMLLTPNGTVYAKSTIGNGGWNQETDAGVGAAVAVSSTGVQMVLVTDGEVWAKSSIGYGGWTGEASAGTASAIAVGGTTQMLLTPNGTVYAKSTIGNGGWNQETDAGVGAAVAVSSTGVQMVLVTDGEVWAKSSIGYGGWTGEASAGTASAVAVSG